jgi:hypothetical protein
MNIAAGCLHMLDFLGGMNGGKGLMLDFVGQGGSGLVAENRVGLAHLNRDRQANTRASSTSFSHSRSPARPITLHPPNHISHHLLRQQPRLEASQIRFAAI